MKSLFFVRLKSSPFAIRVSLFPGSFLSRVGAIQRPSACGAKEKSRKDNRPLCVLAVGFGTTKERRGIAGLMTRGVLDAREPRRWTTPGHRNRYLTTKQGVSLAPSRFLPNLFCTYQPEEIYVANQDRFERIRQTRYIGPVGLERLQGKTIAVLGLGNIGCQAAYHLALLGVKLILVDRGRVEESNLATQGYQTTHLGRPKAYALKRRLNAINPECAITPVFDDIQNLGFAAITADLYLCCLDTLADRLTVNERAWGMRIPWIDAALDGTGHLLYGKATVFDSRIEDVPCYLCSWDSQTLQANLRAERERANEDRPSEGCPNWKLRVARDELSPATLSISGLGGIIAGLQSILAIELLLGEPGNLNGLEVSVDLQAHIMRQYRGKRNQNCLFGHERYDARFLESKQQKLTVAQLFEKAEHTLQTDTVVLRLHGRSLVTGLQCSRCKAIKKICTAEHAITAKHSRCGCGSEMRASGYRLLDSLTREQAGPFLGQTWEDMGFPPKDLVTAANGRTEIHFVLP